MAVRSGSRRAPAGRRHPPCRYVHVGSFGVGDGRCLPPGAWRTRVMPPEVSVIVLNYNGRHWLTACLDALAAQQDSPPFEVILVDNASSDGSADFVRANYPNVQIHETGSNLGFAEGNNAGARLARGRLLVFLNNDTVAAADWLGVLTRALDDKPSFGFATSRIVFADAPERVDSAGDGYLRVGGAY